MDNRSESRPVAALLLANLVLWVVYFALGRLGLMLALPPGYASPLFLPAGIALAACAVFGPGLLPAVALGSLAINLVYPWLSPEGVTQAKLLGALAATVGATLQSWLGSTLFRRLVDPAIGAGRDVVRFLLLAAGITFVSCSVSLGGMALVHVVPWDELPLEWLAWWIGDTIGILLAAPLTWIAIGQPRALWWRRRTLVGLPLLLSAAAFIVIYLQADEWESSQQLQTFRLKAQQTGDALQAQFSEHERFIAAMARALNDPRRMLSASDFSNMAHGYLDQRDELLSMAWMQPVLREHRAAFEAWGRENIEPGFEIRQLDANGVLQRADDRARYCVATYIEPELRRPYLGLDFMSDPERNATLQRALRSGQPTTSPPLPLVRHRGHGLLLLQPVFPTPDHSAPMGTLLIAIQLDTYLDHILKRVDFPHFQVRLQDLDAPLPQAMVRDTLGRRAHSGDFQQQLRFGGRRYALTLAPTPDYLQQQHGWQSWTVLSCGLLLTSLLGALMLLISGERARIQAQVREATAHIHRLAHHDTLTGLDNRLSLNLRLDLLLAQTRRNQGTAALLFLDLDHFKKINDSHGHATGDLLLVAVAKRLQELLREVDTIARLGGDEFIVVTSGNVTPDEASNIAVRIVDALSAPYHLGDKTVHSGASVGVAMFPSDGDDAGTLLRHADTAMYAAKSQGRGNFQFFSPAMNAATHERLLLENRLWQALEQKEFELYLQPQIRLADQAIIGAEVLLRWHHPELGMVGPDRFIPIAEESGLILPLGDWVLQQATGLLASWRTQGMGELRLAVNLSARQCHGAGLLPQLDHLLSSQGINPALLELEITESAAMQDPERSRKLLRELRARGIKVAIDDFGTGYSSLSYLKLFEIDRIKIDRGFVKDIETDPNDAVIVAATIALAHSLGLSVVAEGVETQAQRDFLRSKLCEEAQGYLFARPLPVKEFEALVIPAQAGIPF